MIDLERKTTEEILICLEELSEDFHNDWEDKRNFWEFEKKVWVSEESLKFKIDDILFYVELIDKKGSNNKAIVKNISMLCKEVLGDE